MNGVTINGTPDLGDPAEFRVHHLESCNIALVVSTGACRVQTYATRDELRALGEMLLRHANENEVLEVAA